jgi:hypothetical protein
MPGLVPGIHVLAAGITRRKTWIAGTSPAMTTFAERSALPQYYSFRDAA